MTILELKVEAIGRALLAKDPIYRNSALADLKFLMSADRSGDVKKNIAEAVDQCLLDLGVPERLRGHRYLQVAIQEVVNDPELVFKITSRLYPKVAEKLGTTPSRAERGIRHAIGTSWVRCDLETQAKYFGNTVNPLAGKPTNGEFIAKVASIVRAQV